MGSIMEQSIETHIGDEIAVTVWFDYEPAQQQTHWDPAYTSEVTINAVCVDGDKERDIEAVLSCDTLQDLNFKCFEHMETEQESQE